MVYDKAERWWFCPNPPGVQAQVREGIGVCVGVDCWDLATRSLSLGHQTVWACGFTCAEPWLDRGFRVDTGCGT
jgi:hypothetical protein